MLAIKRTKIILLGNMLSSAGYMTNKESDIRDNSHLQRQKRFKGISERERIGGYRHYDDII